MSSQLALLSAFVASPFIGGGTGIGVAIASWGIAGVNAGQPTSPKNLIRKNTVQKKQDIEEQHITKKYIEEKLLKELKKTLADIKKETGFSLVKKGSVMYCDAKNDVGCTCKQGKTRHGRVVAELPPNFFFFQKKILLAELREQPKNLDGFSISGFAISQNSFDYCLDSFVKNYEKLKGDHKENQRSMVDHEDNSGIDLPHRPWFYVKNYSGDSTKRVQPLVLKDRSHSLLFSPQLFPGSKSISSPLTWDIIKKASAHETAFEWPSEADPFRAFLHALQTTGDYRGVTTDALKEYHNEDEARLKFYIDNCADKKARKTFEKHLESMRKQTFIKGAAKGLHRLLLTKNPSPTKQREFTAMKSLMEAFRFKWMEAFRFGSVEELANVCKSERTTRHVGYFTLHRAKQNLSRIIQGVTYDHSFYCRVEGYVLKELKRYVKECSGRTNNKRRLNHE